MKKKIVAPFPLARKQHSAASVCQTIFLERKVVSSTDYSGTSGSSDRRVFQARDLADKDRWLREDARALNITRRVWFTKKGGSGGFQPRDSRLERPKGDMSERESSEDKGHV